MKWLLTAGRPSPALRAATLLYLHGVGVSASTKVLVKDVDFGTRPTSVLTVGSRPVFITDQLSSILRWLATRKAGDDLLLGYGSIPEFHATSGGWSGPQSWSGSTSPASRP